MRPRDELVVGLDLVEDGRLARDALGPEHLLDLHQHRVPILEDTGRVLAEPQAPRLLLLDDTGAETIADRLVFGEPEDLCSFDRLHAHCSFGR